METETMTLPAIGDKLIALHVPGWSTFNGQVFTVTGVDSTSPIRAYGEFMLENGRTETLYVEKWVPESTINNDSRVVDLTAQVDQLKQELRDAKYAYDELQEARRTIIVAHEGFAKVSERLNDEAEERGWCDTFDAIMDEVNDSLEGPFSLTLRMKDYVVDVTLAVSSHISLTTAVSARNHREARELVSDDFDSYFDSSDISQAMSDSEVHDWSIEEIESEEA